MRLTVTILLVAAVALCHAEEANTSRSKQQKEDVRTEKRALMEGNASLEKRAPTISTVTPSATPGIEYAEGKNVQEKPAEQQIYATPGPLVAKISDVLTGQGPPFQAAIASHLYSPVSIYQPRLGTPTTYAVSAPVPSQLAYTEHKIAYQPLQNAIQYTPQEYRQPLPNPKEAIARLTINYQQRNQVPYYQQQVLTQPQTVVYSQPQVSQQVYQQIPQQQVGYNQNHLQLQPVQIYAQNQAQESEYAQGQQSLGYSAQQVQPAVVHTQKEVTEDHQEPAERELKATQPEQINPPEKQVQAPQVQENYNAQSQGAIRYASYSHSPQTPQIQPQQYHVRSQQYQAPLQYQQQYQIQPYQAVQYQPQLQYIMAKPELAPTNIIPGPAKVVSTNPSRQVAYFRQGPSLQLFQQSQTLPLNREVQHQGYIAQPLAAAPTFPSVQYFGKFAQSIFGGHQHR